DEPSLRLVCRVNLEPAGYEVFEAATGTEALAVAVEAQPDVILLDVKMPGLNGWQVAEALVSEPRTSSIAIVFVSALTAQDDQLRGIEIGGIAYLTKPFDPTMLPAFLNRVLAESARNSASLVRAKRVAELRAQMSVA